MGMTISKTASKMTKHDQPRLMTRDEVAEYLNVSPKNSGQLEFRWRRANPGEVGKQIGDVSSR